MISVDRVKWEKAHIKLLKDRYVSKTSYRCSILKKIYESQASKLLEMCLIIEETKSSFTVPVIRKKMGKNVFMC